MSTRPDMLLCPECQPGEWIIETESRSQYLFDGRDQSAATVARLPDAGGGTDLALRREGDPIRVVEPDLGHVSCGSLTKSL